MPTEPSSPLILVVDDDKVLCQLFTVLYMRSGYRVVTATNGMEGLQYALKSSPDIISLDTDMPVMHGFELLQTLRRDPRTQRTPIVIHNLRPYSSGAYMEAIRRGADEAVITPFIPREMRAIIQVILKYKEELDALEARFRAISQLQSPNGSTREVESTLIAYEREDWQDYISSFVKLLEDNQLTAWVGQSWAPGSDEWLIAFEHALRDCKRMVICLSPNVEETPYVRFMARMGVLAQKQLMPLRFRGEEFEDGKSFPFSYRASPPEVMLEYLKT